jgi:hypothetical protein
MRHFCAIQPVARWYGTAGDVKAASRMPRTNPNATLWPPGSDARLHKMLQDLTSNARSRRGLKGYEGVRTAWCAGSGDAAPAL